MSGTSRQDFENIFDCHFQKVYAYVAYRVAPDAEAAKDITQDVFLAALDGLDNVRNKNAVASWLRSVARNKVADHFGRQFPYGSSASVSIDPSYDHNSTLQSTLQDPTVLVSLVMRQLSANYGELLEDKYLEDLSVKEIARKRKMTDKAVESALSRARDSFRKVFVRLQSQLQREDNP